MYLCIVKSLCGCVLVAFYSTCSVYTAGEGLEFTGEPLIREESLEVDTSGDGRPDVAGNQVQDEQEKDKNPCTDQQTQESEVRLTREFSACNITLYCSTADGASIPSVLSCECCLHMREL